QYRLGQRSLHKKLRGQLGEKTGENPCPMGVTHGSFQHDRIAHPSAHELFREPHKHIFPVSQEVVVERVARIGEVEVARAQVVAGPMRGISRTAAYETQAEGALNGATGPEST